MRTLLLLVAAFAFAPAQAAPGCRATSAAQVTPLVELYTSEGCDSCPPADRWFAATFPPGDATRGVPVAFHVDYWDRLGWKDRFASPAFSERQHTLAQARGDRLVYTPQVLVQGREVRDWAGSAALRAADAARSRPARAWVTIEADVAGGQVAVDAIARRDLSLALSDGVLYVAYVDSGLVSEVSAGENRGERLRHDHVVRELQAAELFTRGETRSHFVFRRPAEKGRSPAIVAFVQNRATGEVLQSLVLPIEACP